MPDITLRITREEALKLARLVGHHTTGRGFDRLYDHLCSTLGIDMLDTEQQPLPPAESHDIYGSRPMVRVD